MTTTFCLIFSKPTSLWVKIILSKNENNKNEKTKLSETDCIGMNVMEESYILATSPNVQPGGGQGGSVTVEPPTLLLAMIMMS